MRLADDEDVGDDVFLAGLADISKYYTFAWLGPSSIDKLFLFGLYVLWHNSFFYICNDMGK